MESQRSLNGKIIAIVDDHGPVLRAASRFLMTFGAQVLYFNNGYAFLRDLPVLHCLVVDYAMPGMNGIELAAELRKRACSTPVIIWTGKSNEIPKQFLVEVGIKEVVDKFSGGDELVRAIHRHAR
jgi:FixJ family two-component response regulator